MATGEIAMKAAFIICLISCFSSLNSFAQSRTDTFRRGAAARSSFQAIAFNPTLDANRTILNELLGSDSPQYQWPSFPRTWYQMDKAKNQEATTTFGGSLKLGIGSGSGKTGISYSYGQKVSLVVISSLRKNSSVSVLPNQQITDEPSDINELMVFDRKSNQRFFNVSEEFPMVGLCVYEMSLKIARSTDGSISFLGISQGLNLSEYQSETIILYSNFFQVDPKLSVQDHMASICETHFLKKAKPHVEEDFDKVLLEYFSNYHPGNQCQIGGPSSENGDESCLLWHQRTFKGVTRSTTVPRCEQQSDGLSRCVIRSKRGAHCPMYLDEKNQFTDGFHLYRQATITTYAHRCDQGLKCTIERKPLGFGGAVLWPGSATCK